MFGGNFAPAGWAFCNGQQMSIAENESLFQLIGTTYGGDGQSTFNLPDLQSRVPIHNGSLAGTSFTLGEQAGVETVTLNTQQLPAHTHPLQGADVQGALASPGNALLARSHTGTVFLYVEDVPSDQMAQAIGPIGGGQPHENIMPYLAISFIISLFGVFPSPT
jgi:microcystin-dependent protein